MIPASVLKPFTLTYPVKESKSNRDAGRALRYHDRLSTYVSTRKPTIIPQLGLSKDYRTAPVQRLSSGENLLSLDRVRQKEMLIMYGLVPPPGMLDLSSWVHRRLSELAPFVNVPNYTPTLQHWIALTEDQRADAINTSGSPDAVDLLRAAAQARVARGVAAASAGAAAAVPDPQVQAINAERARRAAQSALDAEVAAAEALERQRVNQAEAARQQDELNRAVQWAQTQLAAQEVENQRVVEAERLANTTRQELLSLELQQKQAEVENTLQSKALVFEAGKQEAAMVAQLAIEQGQASALRKRAAEEEQLAARAVAAAGEDAITALQVRTVFDDTLAKYNAQLAEITTANQYKAKAIEAAQEYYQTLLEQRVTQVDAEKMRLDMFKHFKNQWEEQNMQVLAANQRRFDANIKMIESEDQIDVQARAAANALAQELARRDINEASIQNMHNQMYEYAAAHARNVFEAYVARQNGLPRDSTLPGATRLLTYQQQFLAIMPEPVAPVQMVMDRFDDENWSDDEEAGDGAGAFFVGDPGAGFRVGSAPARGGPDTNEMLLEESKEDLKRKERGFGRLSEISQRKSQRGLRHRSNTNLEEVD